MAGQNPAKYQSRSKCPLGCGLIRTLDGSWSAKRRYTFERVKCTVKHGIWGSSKKVNCAKWLSRSRCCSGCGVVGSKEPCVRWGSCPRSSTASASRCRGTVCRRHASCCSTHAARSSFTPSQSGSPSHWLRSVTLSSGRSRDQQVLAPFSRSRRYFLVRPILTLGPLFNKNTPHFPFFYKKNTPPISFPSYGPVQHSMLLCRPNGRVSVRSSVCLSVCPTVCL